MAGPFTQSPFPLFIVQAWVLSPNVTVPAESLHISPPLNVLASMTTSTQSQSLLATPQSTMQCRFHPFWHVAHFSPKANFPTIPVRQGDWDLLGLCWMCKFYHDKCLPFGLCSSPFATIESALEHIFAHHLHTIHCSLPQ